MDPVATNPYDDRLAAQQRMLADPLRQSQAQRMEALALLGMLSGDDALGPVGQNMLAMSSKQRDRDDAQAARLEDKASAYSGALAEARQKAQERADAAQQQRQWQQQQAASQHEFQAGQNALMRGVMTGNQTPVAVLGPGDQPVYVGRAQAVGQQPAPSGGGQPSEGERNAAGFSAIMDQATQTLDRLEQQGRMSRGTQVLNSIPLVGNSLAVSAMSPAQQQYSQAAQAWVRAKLRKESGAAIGKDEMLGEIATFFPQPGEGPEVTAQKQAARALANRAMAISAGRATPVSGPGLPRARAAAASAPGNPQPSAQGPISVNY